PCVLRGDAGLHAVLDIGGTQPLRDRHLMDPEVLGDLCQRHTGTTVPGDPHDVLTKLTGIGPGHSNILPACSASKRSEMSQIRAAAPPSTCSLAWYTAGRARPDSVLVLTLPRDHERLRHSSRGV